MTTAHARAVSHVFGPRLRSALMAAASGAVLLNLASPAGAASCIADGADNVCIITLNDLNDTQDGQGGNDTLTFDDAANSPLAVTASQFETQANGGNFYNFETAQVAALTTLNITSAANDAPVSMNWIVNGTLGVSGAGGNSIGDTSALTVNNTGVFNVNESEVIGSLAGAGSVVIAGTKTLTAGNNTNTTFSGVISGAGGFTKSGIGTLTLDGDNSYTGTTNVSGTLKIGHAGAIDQSSLVVINLGGTLEGTGAYVIGGDVVNHAFLHSLLGQATINGDVDNNHTIRGSFTINGNVDNNGIIDPGASPGIITVVGDYTAGPTTATSGFLNMEVDLDPALAAPVNGTTHDFFDIQGNVTGAGQTFVFLVGLDPADVGGPTPGPNGIQLIRITGTSPAGAFVQGNALNAGALQYLLTFVPNYAGTDDGYFLQSALRDELVAHPALVSAGQELLRHCFRDDQRIPDSPKGATYGRAWVGYHQGNTEFGADTGIEMDQDYSCTSGGMDWRLGYGWFGGVSGGFGTTDVDLVAPAGIGNLDGDARVIEVYTTFTSSSLFLNLSAGYADMDWVYTGAVMGAVQATSGGFIGSAQAGVALDVDPFAVKLIGTINYDDTNCGENCFGFAVVEDAGGLLEAKGTVRFDAVSWGGSVRPWAAVSYSDVLSNGVNAVSLGAFGSAITTNEQRVSIDAGLQSYLDENLALFAEGGYHESLNKEITGYRAGVGMKLYW